MHDTTPPEATATLAYERIVKAVRRGERLACTRSHGGVPCLRLAIAWCPTCVAPRCGECSATTCGECDNLVVPFWVILDGAADERHGLLDHGDRA